jgi:hypothetical protein
MKHASLTMLKSWRTSVVNALRRSKVLTDNCKITGIKSCGTLMTSCGKSHRTGISFSKFESLHSF